MSETKQQSSWFTSCLGKLVFWLWLIVIGAVGGVWLGINIERMYPGLRVPVVPLVENVIGQITLVTRKARTPDGLVISILDFTNVGTELNINVSATNDGNEPEKIRYRNFNLRDKRNRLYDVTPSTDLECALSMLLIPETLNPGLSMNYCLSFAVPTNVKSFNLYYDDTKIGSVK